MAELSSGVRKKPAGLLTLIPKRASFKAYELKETGSFSVRYDTWLFLEVISTTHLMSVRLTIRLCLWIK